MMTPPNPKGYGRMALALPSYEGMGEGIGMPSPSMVHLGGRLHEAG